MKNLLVIMLFVLSLPGCGGDSPPDISDAEVLLKKEFQHYKASTDGVLKSFTYEKVDGMMDEKSGNYFILIDVIYGFSDMAISFPMIVTFEKRESGWVPVRVGKDSERDTVVIPSATVKE